MSVSAVRAGVSEESGDDGGLLGQCLQSSRTDVDEESEDEWLTCSVRVGSMSAFWLAKGWLGVDGKSCGGGGSLLVVMFCRCLICTGEASTGVGEQNGDCGSSVASFLSCLICTGKANTGISEENDDCGSPVVTVFSCLICTGKASTGVGEENGDCGSPVVTVFYRICTGKASTGVDKVAMMVCCYNKVLSLSYLHWQGEHWS